MPYSNFTLRRVEKEFDLQIVEQLGIFHSIQPVAISDYFRETLQENLSLAVAINTEKARSELLVANALIELRKIFDRQISFFSGIDLNIDRLRDLSGFCDFIVSLSGEQLFLKAPAIAIVEAKNENLVGGLGQCVAEAIGLRPLAKPIAVRLFNEKEGNSIPRVYGTVTSGVLWKFLKLVDNTVYIDLSDYSLETHPQKVIGILSAMVSQKA